MLYSENKTSRPIYMASSRDHHLSLRNKVMVVLILYLTIPPSKSGKHLSIYENQYIYIFIHSMSNFSGEHEGGLKVKMAALGSSPPKCVNKCLGCKPCMAALVISPPQIGVNQSTTIFVRDETYYLLSWKCRCRNKYFQP